MAKSNKKEMREVEDSTDIKRYFYKNNPADKIYWVSLFRESIDKDGKKAMNL